MQTSNILAKINDGIFFERIFGQELDWDAALDARDSGAFDAAGVRATKSWLSAIR